MFAGDPFFPDVVQKNLNDKKNRDKKGGKYGLEDLWDNTMENNNGGTISESIGKHADCTRYRAGQRGLPDNI